jgi:hypothetical protein
MHDHDDLHDDGLARMADRLRAQRPELTAIELDEVGRRVRARVAAPSARRRTRNEFMKSRLAILGMLVAGMLFSTTGGALAISGFASSSNASIAQYGGVQGESNGSGNPSGGNNTNNPSGGNNSGLEPVQQVEAGANGGNTLPFTGFAAIPVLIGGVALLSGGLVMRRRTQHDE